MNTLPSTYPRGSHCGTNSPFRLILQTADAMDTRAAEHLAVASSGSVGRGADVGGGRSVAMPESTAMVSSAAKLLGAATGRSIVAKTVFYSFHYGRDVHRVQLVRNIAALEGQPLLNSQDWETIRRRGDQVIENWITEQMSHKRAVVVLIGQQTASRPWVKYEIQKAWNNRKPLLGVRIHGLSSMGTVDQAGADPFEAAGLAHVGIPVFDPTSSDSQATYAALRLNLAAWSDRGVRQS